MNYPQIEQKIISEISTVLRESRGQDTKKWLGQPLVFEEAENLIYLKAALAETLRLYPLVPGDFKHVMQYVHSRRINYDIFNIFSSKNGDWPRVCLGERLGLPTNEVCSLCYSALLPAFTSSRTLGGAEDVSHSIHEERHSCLLAAVPTSIVDGQIWVIRVNTVYLIIKLFCLLVLIADA
ncbi:hypothetical protein V6N13_058654 [Hibiscus sabdariffa]|uniref:Cytochrome P450 n=1 Tax=Hibiscus sabdariffa TaxID=183260 RepID=A0ABR2GFI0_9ROSI